MAQDEELTFETALQQLEAIVAKLDSGDLPLEEALALFQEGTRLREHCTRLLTAAEAQVEGLLPEMNAGAEAAPQAPASLFGDD